MEDNIENNNIIQNFIKERLDKYDKSNSKYNHLIEMEEVKFNEDDELIIFKEKDIEIYKSKTTILGSFDLNTKIWLWAWVTPFLTASLTKDSRNILKYGLELEPFSNSNIHFYIKAHFVNSRIYFENDIYLDIHLALSLYIIKMGKFIYPKKIKETNTIIYYIVY